MSKHHTPLSEAQLNANRANAQLSTGPQTPEGKRTVSHNALKTGLTGRTILLPTDDLAAYETHLASVEARYRPATDEERLHAQSIAHIEWRLLRIPTIETGILALGRKRFADTHSDESPENRAVLIEAEVALEFQKQLANLALQETRLNRQHERETAKLEKLQTARKAVRDAQLEEVSRFYTACSENSWDFSLNDLHRIGFVFSMDEVKRAVAARVGLRKGAQWPTIQAHYVFQNMQAA